MLEIPSLSERMGEEGEMRLERQVDFHAKELGLHPMGKRQQMV